MSPRQRTGLQPLFTYFRELLSDRRRIAFAILIACVKHSPVIILPLYISWIIDQVIPTRDLAGLAACFVGMLSLIVVNLTLHPVYIHLYSRVRRDVATRLRARLCEKIQQIVFAYHDNTQSGRLHSKVMQDVERIDTLAMSLIDPHLTNALTAVTALCIILHHEPAFGLIVLFFLPLVLLVLRLMRKRINDRFHDLREEQEQLNAEVAEMLQMLTLSRAHAAETQELRRIGLRLDRVRQQGLRTDWYTHLLFSQIWGLTQVVTILVVCAGAWLVIGGRISVGQVVMFISFVGMTIGTLSGLMANASVFIQANESMRSILEVLDYPEVEDNAGKPGIPALTGRVELHDVWFTYPGTERPVLKSINLTIEPGQTIALVGPSGAGKTTFVKLLLGFYKPIQGTLLIDGQDLAGIDLRTLRRQVGIVTQETFLFNGTVLQNLTHGMDHHTMEQVVDAATKAHAHEFIATLPDQYDTEIGDRGLKLSGGQKQRLAIARAILRHPRLLILDEATSSLDSQSERLIKDALDVLRQGRTTFVIAHRLSTIRNADRILVFEDGRIVEEGRHEVLIRQGGVYARLVELQAIG